MNFDPHSLGKLRKNGQTQLPISSAVVSTFAVACDSAAILLSGGILYALRINISAETFAIYAAAICAIWATTLVLFQISDLYRFTSILKPIASLDRIAIAFATAFLFLLAAAFAFKISSTLSRLYIGYFALFSFSTVFVCRLIMARIIHSLSKQGRFTRNVILVGEAEHIARLRKHFEKLNLPFVAIVAAFVPKPGEAHFEDIPVLGKEGDITQFVRNYRVDDVVIAIPWSAEERIRDLVEKLRELPVNTYLGADLIGLSLDFNEPPSHYSGAPLFSVIGRPISGWGVFFKAVEDYLLGSLILILAAIPMALVALLIKLDSPGPVLFRQKRLGFNNQVFEIYKFRTMHHEGKPQEKTVQATRDDPRVTRIGKWLRRTSIDELPQLFNVLDGSMSLVGPRPHALDHNEEYSRQIRGYFARHRVKPGITGWAQVHGLRGETDTTDKMEARVRHDAYYAENWSIFLDVKILMWTAVVLFRNAY